MELSEAKEVLKNIKRCCLDDEQYQKYGFMEQYIDISDVEAIDTILKALDNSINKDEVKKVLERENKKYNEAVNDVYKNPANALVDFQRVCGKREVLKELLGE